MTKPQPTHLKLVKGITRKDRLPVAEPKAPAGAPPPPARFTSPAARAAWLRFARDLESMGVLAKVDGAALTRMAEVYAQVQQLQQNIANHGHTYRTFEVDKAGRTIPNTGLEKARPEVGMLSDADRRLRAYLVEFGLTPSARTRVKAAEGGSSSDDFDA